VCGVPGVSFTTEPPLWSAVLFTRVLGHLCLSLWSRDVAVSLMYAGTTAPIPDQGRGHASHSKEAKKGARRRSG